MLGSGAERRADDAVDIVRLETGVGDGPGGSFEHETELGLAGAAGESAFADPDDTGFILE